MKPGEDMGTAYKVSDLSSLFSVCALAMSAADEWSDDIADSLRQDIKHTLELGARLAEQAGMEVGNLETDLRELQKGAVDKTGPTRALRGSLKSEHKVNGACG